jgi:hypothetical protein
MPRGFVRFLRRNTIALLALFIALSGTTYAASTLLPRNSVGTAQLKNGAVTKKKINKKTIKALKGNRGPRGLTGAAGAAGAAGAKGATGAQGVQGIPGPFPDPLPGGKTLRGNFMTSGNNGGAAIHSAVSFGFRLSAAPTVHYITNGTAPPAVCPGSVTNPQANPGHLCVYEIEADNVTAGRGVCNLETAGCPAGTASREGFGVYAFIQTAGTPLFVFGSWAVTAVTGAAAPAGPGAQADVSTTR